MKYRSILVGAALAIAATSSANAATIVLNFEGVGSQAQIKDFYNGGTDSKGNSGTNYGVSFPSFGYGLIDADDGGFGNIANVPSGNTVLTFPNPISPIMNYAAGFTTGFSFFYSSSKTASTVRVYDGLNGTGNLLGSLNLVSQYKGNSCVGDPAGAFCNWTAIGMSFNGVAKSIHFGNGTIQTMFDDVTLGSATPGAAVPEPATWAMMIIGFGAVGSMVRASRRRNAFSAA